MKKHTILAVIIISIFLGACEDYLDQVPEKDVETIESIFERKSKADVWFTQATEFLTDSWLIGFGENVGSCGADEFVTGNYIRNTQSWMMFQVADGLQMSQWPLGNIWPNAYYHIRMLNVFIENVDRVYDLTAEEKKNWKAEAIAVKAYFYFELVRRYGPIVLVPENIDVNADLKDMQVPRSHVDTCFNEIIRLLDKAIPDLYTSKDRIASHKLFLSKEGALALKARVLLYQASPLFNGNEFYVDFKGKQGEPLFNAEYDPEKWKRAAEAADAAVEYCESQGYRLNTGEQNKPTKLLNQMRDIELSIWESDYDGVEALFMTGDVNIMFSWYQYLLPCFPEGHPDRDANLYGCVGPSMKMVEMFYTKNGLPISMDKEWSYTNRYKMGRELNNDYEGVVVLNEDILNLHLKREPRFYAHIAADRCYWQRGNRAGDNKLVEAYRGEAFGLQKAFILASEPQNTCGYYIKKFTRSEIQTYSYMYNAQTLGPIRYPVIRLAELYLIQAEAWNEYEGPSDKVYKPLNKVRERAGIPDVETSWKRYSYSPQKIATKEGMREIIQHENAVEFAFEAHRYWDLRRWKKAHLELNDKILGWNVLGDNARSFYNNYEGPVVIWDKTKFVSPRDYFFPIKSEEVMIAGYVQNPGW